MAQDYHEKRGFIRMELNDTPVRYETASGERGGAVARDLSATGMRLISKQSFAPGTVLRVHMQPEQALVPPLDAEVEVIRVDEEPGGYALGVEIVRFIQHAGDQA